jgi:hypothetical protein
MGGHVALLLLMFSLIRSFAPVFTSSKLRVGWGNTVASLTESDEEVKEIFSIC